MRWREWLPGETGPGAGGLRVAQAALLVLAFAMPLSIAITEIALVTGVLALIVSRLRGRRWRVPDTWLLAAALAMASSWLLSSAFSAEPAGSFYHVRKLYAMLLIPLAAEAGRDPRVRDRAVRHVVLGAVITALIGFLIYAVRVPSHPGYRLQSVLSNQMTSGGVLAAALLWSTAAALARRSVSRWAYALASVPVALALVLTQTRSHWLGAVFGATAVFIALAPRAWWTVPVAAVVVARLAPARIVSRLASIVDPHEPGNQGRLSMWRSGRDIIRQHPLLGVGCQDLLTLYRRFRYPDWTFESGHFHNNFVQLAVSTGAVGVAAFLFWIVAAFRELARGLGAARSGADRGMAAAGLGIIVALLVSGMFDYTFGDAEVINHTYLALGLALAVRATPAGETSSEPDRARSGDVRAPVLDAPGLRD